MEIDIRESRGISLLLQVPAGTLVADIKDVISEQLHVDQTAQNLVYHGLLLKDSSSLEEIGVENGEIMTLVVEGEVASATLDRICHEAAAADSGPDSDEALSMLKEYEIDDLMDLSMELQASQEAIGEVHRLTDLAMTAIEGNPSVYRDLIASVKEMDEREAAIYAANDQKTPVETVIPGPASGPSCAPLPMMFFNEDDVVTQPSSSPLPVCGARGRIEMPW